MQVAHFIYFIHTLSSHINSLTGHFYAFIWPKQIHTTWLSHCYILGFFLPTHSKESKKCRGYCLRSQDSFILSIPNICTEFGKRAFKFAAPIRRLLSLRYSFLLTLKFIIFGCVCVLFLLPVWCMKCMIVLLSFVARTFL